MTRYLVGIIFLCSFLEGCTTVSNGDSRCMKVSLITALSKVSLSHENLHEIRSLSVSNFKGGCGGTSADLPGKSDEIGINLTLFVPEAKKSTHKKRTVTLGAFVALVDKNDQIKDRFDEKIKLVINDYAVSHTHKIIYRLPQDIKVNDQNYRILVGLKEGAVSSQDFENKRSKA